MPMDDRTKAAVRALLDRHPRGYAAEEAGFAVARSAAGLLRLLVLSVPAGGSAPSAEAVEGTRALPARRRDSAPEMAKTTPDDRAAVLRSAGHPGPEEASACLGEATACIIGHYAGNLGNLRREADGDRRRLRGLLLRIPGLGEAGYAASVRDAQVPWPEAGPFPDSHAVRAAGRPGLPDNPGELLRDVARGPGGEMLGWPAGALALTDAHGDYDRIREDAS